MATVSSLSAPGVEVREYDNSLRISSNTGTTVFVPGYAAQGPVEEVIQIGSITDFENVYGIPTNDAERYFYYTCLAILNNSGLGTTLLTSRLPYGSGEGDNVANAYTLLAYPVIPFVKNSDKSKSYEYFEAPANFGAHFTLNEEVPTVTEAEVLIYEKDKTSSPVIKAVNFAKIPGLEAEFDKAVSNTISWTYGDIENTANPVDIYTEVVSVNGVMKLRLHMAGQLTQTVDEKTAPAIIGSISAVFDYSYDNTAVTNLNAKTYVDVATLGFGAAGEDSTFTYVASHKIAEKLNDEDNTTDVSYILGAPATFNVSLSEYYQIVSGEYFNWQNAKTDYSKFGQNLKETLSSAALIAINTSRSTINDSYEGYYFGITDNMFNEPSSDYMLNAVTGVKFTNWNRDMKNGKEAGIVDSKTLSDNKFIKIAPSRLDFYTASSNKGSISNVLQTGVSSFSTSSVDYDDTINMVLFKLSKSTVGTEAMKLTYGIVEKYNASLGKTRVHSVANAVTPQNYFVENIIESTKNLTLMVNPYIASKIKVDSNGVLRGKVRFLSTKLVENYGRYKKSYLLSTVSDKIATEKNLSKRIKLAKVNISNWENLCTRIGADLETLSTLASDSTTYDKFNLNDNLYPIATYTVVKKNNKFIGSTPLKIQRALELVSNDEEYPDLDIVVEGGLGTIYAYSNNAANAIAEGSQSLIAGEDTSALDGDNGENQSTFSADMILQGVEDLRTSRSTITEDAQKIIEDYTAVQEAFQSLANSFQNGGRGDTFYIADILRGVFLRGANTKVEKLYGTTLTNNVYSEAETVNHSWATSIYNPIKHLVENFTTSYASVYAQWVKILDGFTNEKHWVPVSGFMTALMCASDALQGPWYAAAGLNRGIVEGVLDAAINPNQKQRGDLYKICVNSVPKLANIGITSWGIRTLSKKASAFDQNTCRRTFLFIEKAIKKLLRYYVFEPNNSYTQLSIYNEIEPYMESIRNQGGIYSYSVVCDKSNNTAEIVNAGNLAVDVSAAPTRTAEFIVLNMTANKYTNEVSTNEFNG